MADKELTEKDKDDLRNPYKKAVWGKALQKALFNFNYRFYYRIIS